MIAGYFWPAIFSTIAFSISLILEGFTDRERSDSYVKPHQMAQLSKRRENSLNKASDLLSRASFFLGVSAISLIILFLMFDLITRTLGRPVGWVAEISVYLYAFSICTSLPYVTRQGAQIAVTLLPETLPGRVRTLLYHAVEMLSCFVCVVVSILFAFIMVQQYQAGTTTVADISIAKWILSAMFAYGFFFSGLMHLVNAVSARKQDDLSAEGSIQ